MIFLKNILPFKVLSFDLDDTLYDNVPVISNAETRFALYICQKYSLPVYTGDSAFWSKMRKSCLDKDPRLENDMSLWRKRSLQCGLQTFGFNVDEKNLEEEVKEFVRIRSEITVPTSSLDLLSDLKKKYPLVALSNGNSDLEQDGLAPFFDFDLRPSYFGARSKPAPDLFLQTANFFQIKPCEILHIGDDPLTDVQGAEGAGCQCVWLCGGIAGKNERWKKIRTLPHAVINSLDELRTLLLG